MQKFSRGQLVCRKLPPIGKLIHLALPFVSFTCGTTNAGPELACTYDIHPRGCAAAAM
jgi:hypothetical protein